MIELGGVWMIDLQRDPRLQPNTAPSRKVLAIRCSSSFGVEYSIINPMTHPWDERYKFTYMNGLFLWGNVGKYTIRPMDDMGMVGMVL